MKLATKTINLYNTVFDLASKNDSSFKVQLFKGKTIAAAYGDKFFDIRSNNKAVIESNKIYLVAAFDITSDKYENDSLTDMAARITNALNNILPNLVLKITKDDIIAMSNNGMYFIIKTEGLD